MSMQKRPASAKAEAARVAKRAAPVGWSDPVSLQGRRRHREALCYLHSCSPAELLGVLGIPVARAPATFIRNRSKDAEAAGVEDFANPFYCLVSGGVPGGPLSFATVCANTWTHELWKTGEATAVKDAVAAIPEVKLKGVYLAHVAISRSSAYARDSAAQLLADVPTKDAEAALLSLPLRMAAK